MVVSEGVCYMCQTHIFGYALTSLFPEWQNTWQNG